MEDDFSSGLYFSSKYNDDVSLVAVKMDNGDILIISMWLEVFDMENNSSMSNSSGYSLRGEGWSSSHIYARSTTHYVCNMGHWNE